MTRTAEIVKGLRAVTSWLCFLGLAWWMMLNPQDISIPVLLIWGVFFLFSFSGPIDRGVTALEKDTR